MYQFLHIEPFDQAVLRAAAANTVSNMDIIQGCGLGEESSYRALLCGFWPYVDEFERAIDRRMLRMLPRRQLTRLYGEYHTRVFLHGAIQALAEMREEEGSHAQLWRGDATARGFPLEGPAPVCYGVRQLTQCTYTDSPVLFFAHLATTEFVAEELTQYLLASPGFMPVLHPGGRWPWGEAHLPHPGGVSHLEVDLDLARAMHLSEESARRPDDAEFDVERRLGEADERISYEILRRLGDFHQAAQEVGRVSW